MKGVCAASSLSKAARVSVRPSCRPSPSQQRKCGLSGGGCSRCFCDCGPGPGRPAAAPCCCCCSCSVACLVRFPRPLRLETIRSSELTTAQSSTAASCSSSRDSGQRPPHSSHGGVGGAASCGAGSHGGCGPWHSWWTGRAPSQGCEGGAALPKSCSWKLGCCQGVLCCWCPAAGPPFSPRC